MLPLLLPNRGGRCISTGTHTKSSSGKRLVDSLAGTKVRASTWTLIEVMTTRARQTNFFMAQNVWERISKLTTTKKSGESFCFQKKTPRNNAEESSIHALLYPWQWTGSLVHWFNFLLWPLSKGHTLQSEKGWQASKHANSDHLLEGIDETKINRTTWLAQATNQLLAFDHGKFKQKRRNMHENNEFYNKKKRKQYQMEK